MKERQQDIEHGDQASQTSLDVGPQAVSHVLEITDDGHHRQGGLHLHAVIPGAFLAQLEVGWNALLAAKAEVREHNGLAFIALDERMESLIMRVEGVPVPVHHLALIVEQPTQFDADGPASFILAFLADLLPTAALTDRKEQFDGIAVNHGEETRLCQQGATPVLVGLKQPLQPSAIRQSPKEVGIVALEPAVKRSEMAAFEGKENANGYHFTRIQFGLAVFAHVFHLIIDNTKNLDDNVFGCHEGSPFCSEEVFRLSLARSS